MYMQNYILSILRSDFNVFGSWGPHRFIAIGENTLMFRVQGFKHRGWVKVQYHPCPDLFWVSFLNNRMKVLKEYDHIYNDQLVSIIDNFVEVTSDYEKTVNEWFTSESRVN